MDGEEIAREVAGEVVTEDVSCVVGEKVVEKGIGVSLSRVGEEVV